MKIWLNRQASRPMLDLVNDVLIVGLVLVCAIGGVQ